MFKKKGNKPTAAAKGGGGGGKGKGMMDADGNDIDIKKLLKDIEFLGSSHMTWKERKELENRKVVSLGGKPPKNQRMNLGVAKVSMKKQKEREQKKLQEGIVLGCFGGKLGSGSRVPEKRKTEKMVLKPTEGHFSKGILDVKHLLNQKPSRENQFKPLNLGSFGGGGAKKKATGKKKSKGKKKGGKKRR